jgi:hypothetical protein
MTRKRKLADSAGGPPRVEDSGPNRENPADSQTHESQEAARSAAQSYLDELTFLQRLANTIKREDREQQGQAAASAPLQQKIVAVKFP